MKTIFSPALCGGSLILLLALAPLGALAQTSVATLRSEISRRYDVFFAAVLSTNTTQLRSVLVDDFTHTDIQGKVRNRAEAEVMLTNLAIRGREEGIGDIVGVVFHRYELLSLDASPSEVRVRGREQLMMQYSGDWWFGETELLDTWVRSGGEWMLQRQQQVAFNPGYASPIDGTDKPSKPSEIESPGLSAVVKEFRAGNTTVLESFWRERQGKGPLVETIPDDSKQRRVTFLWRGSGERVEIVRVWHSKPLTRIQGTDLWYWTESLPSDAYFSYTFYVDVTVTKPSDAKGPEQRFNVSIEKPDALNPPTDFVSSVLKLPDAPPWPWITPRPGAPRGTLHSNSLVSAKLKEERTFTVYLPPGYENSRRRCHLLVAYDGEWCTNMLKAPTVLDNLINAKRIPPMIAVFVNHQDTRERDLGDAYNPFADFVCQELVPWVEHNYRVSRQSQRGHPRKPLSYQYPLERHQSPSL